MRKIGLHLRLTTTLDDLAARAFSLNLPIFQCFFIQQVSNQFISLSDEQIQHFLTHWRPRFQELYVHGSYWINLASAASHNKIISRELELAKRLQFSYMVVHPGSARRPNHKPQGIMTIAHNLNTVLKNEHSIKIILENTAHAGLSIGGDLHDLKRLRMQLDYPEKVLFCLDSAHAYSYGYDISTPEGQQNFFALVEETIELKNVALIHLNDTLQKCSSRIDKHEVPGAGLLKGHLENFIQHEALLKVPLIMELPVVGEDQERSVLELVRGWDRKLRPPSG